MIILFAFLSKVDKYHNNSNKNENITEKLIDKEITELKTKNDNNEKSPAADVYQLTPDGLN